LQNTQIPEAASSIFGRNGSRYGPPLAEVLAKRLGRDLFTKGGTWALSLGPVTVPAFTSVTLQVQPKVTFRGEKLINTGSTNGLYIQSLFVGQNNNLPSLQPIPISLFSSESLCNDFLLDVCHPALYITLIIQNTASQAETFAASLFGKVI
jgi:hypothetical protein